MKGFDIMLKKYGAGSMIVGVLMSIFGIWMVDASEGLWKYKYSSGMRTLLEFMPWVLLLLGVFGIIAGIYYLVQSMKPVTKASGKIIQRNGNSVVFESDDGSRKTLVVMGNIPMVAGDYGTIEYKGSFITKFNK